MRAPQVFCQSDSRTKSRAFKLDTKSDSCSLPDHFIFLAQRAKASLKMDVAVLRDRIVATLDPDADLRRRAELDLKQARLPLSPFVCPY